MDWLTPYCGGKVALDSSDYASRRGWPRYLEESLVCHDGAWWDQMWGWVMWGNGPCVQTTGYPGSRLPAIPNT